MKLIKLILGLCILALSLNSAFSVILFEDQNMSTLTNWDRTYVGSWSFNSSEAYWTSGGNDYLDFSEDFNGNNILYVKFDLKIDSAGNTFNFITADGGTATVNNGLNGYWTATGYDYYNGASWGSITFTRDNNWHNYIFKLNEGGTDTFEIFQDGVSKGTGSYDSRGTSYNYADLIRWRSQTGSAGDNVKNMCIYTDPSDESSCFSSSSPTPQIELNISNGEYFNSSPISVSLNTTSNVNMSIYINGVLNQTFTNLNYTTTSINLIEGLNNLSFKSEDMNGINWNNLSVTLDTLAPNISNNIESTYLSYFIEGFNSSCSDLNLDYCNITLDNQTVNLSVSNFTFTHNGNITYLIEARDLAGNEVTQNGTIFVNPKAYFRFYDTIRSQYVTSYTFGSYAANNTYVEIPIYDLGLGSQSLEFVGFGFKTQNYNFNFTNTSIINQTFNVSPAVLTIKAYDETTLTALTNFNIQINNGSQIELYNGVNNLTLYSDNSSTLLGNLEISISKTNYTSRVYSLTLDAFSVVNLNAYLLGSVDGGYVDFFIYDNNNKVVENALISIYQTINGSDTVIEQIYTDSAGYGGVFIDPTKPNQYFLVLKDGFVQQQYDIRPTTSEYKVYLKALTDVWEPWDNGVNYNIDKHSTNTEPLNLTFTITNQDNDFTLWGFKVYDETNTLIDTIQSTANSGGSLSYFDTGNHSKLRLNYYYQIGTNTESFSKTYYYHFISYNYSSLNVVDMGEDFVQTDEIPNEGKAVLFLIILIFVIAIPNKLPDLKGKGAGLFLGWAVVLYYSYIGGIHWGLSAMAIIGTALIHFDKKTEGRI